MSIGDANPARMLASTITKNVMAQSQVKLLPDHFSNQGSDLPPVCQHVVYEKWAMQILPSFFPSYGAEPY
jgi:hypothetical protein